MGQSVFTLETAMNIGFLGTGVMGASMAGHLLESGHEIALFTRTRAKAEPLLARGATWVDSPREAAEGADVVISIVGMPSDVEAVHLGPNGTLAASTPPALIIDMTTSTPSLARRLHQQAARLSVGAIDAPVSGGDIGARNAALSIMVGGDEADVKTAWPLFDLMGGTIVHQGGPGCGQHTKMVNQILVASTMLGISEGLLYARSAGLNGERVLESVGGGAAGSWTISNLGPRILAGDHAPGFFVDHFLKDLSIALDEAESMGLELPMLALARRFYAEASEKGLGNQGTQVLASLLVANHEGF